MKKSQYIRVASLALVLCFVALAIYQNKNSFFAGINGKSQVANISGAGSNLQVHYTFDTQGSPFADASGNSNSPTVSASAPSWTGSAKVGSGAVSMSAGSNTSLLTNPISFNSSSSAFAVSMWFKASSPSGSYTPIWRFKHLPPNNVVDLGVYLWNDNSLRLYANGPCLIVADSVNSGIWYHVALSQGATGDMRIYLNGESKGTCSRKDISSTASIFIGSDDFTPTYNTPFTGTIDDFRVYDRQLSGSEVSEIFALADDGGTVVPPVIDPPVVIPPVGGGTSDTTNPTVSITSPTSGQTLSGTVTLSATASDNQAVQSVTFKVDGVAIGSPDTSSPYEVSFVTGTVSNGLNSHTVTAVARDTADNTTTSGGVTFSVNNPVLPLVDIISPIVSLQSISISSGVALGTFPFGTTQIIIRATTNDSADCKYSSSAGNLYTLMAGTMSGAGATSHDATVTISGSNPHRYYVRCQDRALVPNANISDTTLTFSVSTEPVVVGQKQTIGASARVEFPTSALWNRHMNFKPGNFDVDGIKSDLNPPIFSWPYDLDPLNYGSSINGDSGGNLPQQKFWLQIDDNSDFLSPIKNIVADYNMYSFLGSDVFAKETKYYWRVRYLDINEAADHTPQRWSGTRSFVIAANATDFDRASLASDSYLMSKSAHPHILFNQDNRRDLYLYLKGKEDNLARYTKNSIDERVGKSWQVLKSQASGYVDASWWGNVTAGDGIRANIASLQRVAIVWSLTSEATTGPDALLHAKLEGANTAQYLTDFAEYFVSQHLWDKDIILWSTATIINNLGYSYDLLYDKLSVDQAKKVRNAIELYINSFFYNNDIPLAYQAVNYNDNAQGWVRDPLHYAGAYKVPIGGLLRNGTSHALDNYYEAMLGAMAIYGDAVPGETSVAKDFLKFAINYFVTRGTPFNYGNGAVNQGIGYGSGGYKGLIYQSALFKMMFPEINFEKNPAMTNGSDFYSRVMPVGFSYGHEPWGDGASRYDDTRNLMSEYQVSRDLALLLNDGDMAKHFIEADKFFSLPVDLQDKNYSVDLFLPYYTKTWYGHDGLPSPTAKSGEPLSRAFLPDGWVAGCSQASNIPGCFKDGVGYVFQARPAGQFGHAGYGDLSYQLWAYGTTITDAGGLFNTQIAGVPNGQYSLLVNGLGYASTNFYPIVPYLSRIFAYKNVTNPDYTYVAADATNHYRRAANLADAGTDATPISYFDLLNKPANVLSDLTKVQRHFLSVKNKYFVVFDDLAATTPRTFTSLFPVLEKNITPDLSAIPAGQFTGQFSYTSNIDKYASRVFPASHFYRIWFKTNGEGNNKSQNVDENNRYVDMLIQTMLSHNWIEKTYSNTDSSDTFYILKYDSDYVINQLKNLLSLSQDYVNYITWYGFPPSKPDNQLPADVTVHVAQIFSPSHIQVKDMTGSEVYKNPLQSGADYTASGNNDALRRNHTLWFSNANLAREWHFFTIIYPQKPGTSVAPTIERIDDYTARVTANDGSGDVDVISFNSATAPADTTILVDLANLTALPVVDDVTNNTVISPPYVPPTIDTKITITVAKSGSGTITGSGISCGTDCSQQVEPGTSITLTATPSADSSFSNWSGGGCSSLPTCTITVTNNLTISAAFSLIVTGDLDAPLITSLPVSDVTTNAATINWSTDELSTSQVEYGLTTSYGNETIAESRLILTHSQTLKGLSPNTTYHYRVISEDETGNEAKSGDRTFPTAPDDKIAPARSNGAPSGTLAAGTNSVSISLATDEPATCKWSTTPKVLYADMTGSFKKSGLNHSFSISTNNIVASKTITDYSYYVRCADSLGNTNIVDYSILFSIRPKDSDPSLPIISITSPQATDNPYAGGIIIQARVVDGTSAISGVQFYVNGNPQGSEDTVAPYSTLWTAAEGTYTLSATVRDANGNRVTSSPVTFSVRAPRATSGGGSSGGGSSGGGTPPVVLPPFVPAPATPAPAAIAPASNTKSLNTTTTAPYNFGNVALKDGSKGEAVKELQRFFNAKLKSGLTIDGKLGPKTVLIIKKWQKDNGLKVDGVVGQKTKALMNSMR